MRLFCDIGGKEKIPAQRTREYACPIRMAGTHAKIRGTWRSGALTTSGSISSGLIRPTFKPLQLFGQVIRLCIKRPSMRRRKANPKKKGSVAFQVHNQKRDCPPHRPSSPVNPKSKGKALNTFAVGGRGTGVTHAIKKKESGQEEHG